MTHIAATTLVYNNQFMISVCRRNGIYNRVIAAKLAAMSQWKDFPIMATKQQIAEALVGTGDCQADEVDGIYEAYKDEIQVMVNKGASAHTVALHILKKEQAKHGDSNKGRTECEGENG